VISAPAAALGGIRDAAGGFAERIGRFASRERIRIYTRLMLAITLGGGAIQAALGPGLLDSFGHPVGVDFLAFYTGGRLFLEGRVDALYDLEAQRALQIAVTGPGLRGMHPFINPPNALPLYLPFACLPYPIAVSLWSLAGLGALAASVALLRSELAALRRYGRGALFGSAFLFFPTVAWLLYGQITPLTLLLYAIAFVAFRRGFDLVGGAALGCLAYKPQLAIALALVLVLKGRWRAVAGGAACALSWVWIGMLLAPEAMWDWARISPKLLAFLRWEEYPRWGLHSLMGLASLLLDGLSPRLAGSAALVLSCGALALVLRAWRRTPWEPGSRGWDLAMGGTFALGLVASPHLFVYDLMLLLLPFAILFHRAGEGREPWLERGPVFAWTVLLWVTSFLGSYLSMAQLELTEWLGLPPIALQVSTLVVLLWGQTLLSLACPGGCPRDPGGFTPERRAG
jgi:hypothetical protein